MGTPPKKSLNFLAFIVADVITILMSLLLYATFLRIPNRTSVFNDLSCASSIITAEYFSRSGSYKDSLNKTPSVIYLITVSLLV